jgi:transposase-like protein
MNYLIKVLNPNTENTTEYTITLSLLKEDNIANIIKERLNALNIPYRTSTVYKEYIVIKF